MNAKTAAEQQLEFLRKLKEKQKSSPRPGPGAGLKTVSTHLRAGRPGHKGAAKRLLRLPLNEDAWRMLKENGLKPGKLKLNQALGNWAVELILEIPIEIRSMPANAKTELFKKVRDWAESRGLE